MFMVKFRIDKSPFKFERNYHAKSVSKSFRLPEDVYEEIMKYYDGLYGEKNNLTKAFNNIVIEKLDNICRERKSYQDLNVMMLIPKTTNLEELNEKSEVIGLFHIDDVENFNKQFLFREENDDEIVIKYELNNHKLESYYDFITHLNPNCFRFDMMGVSSFDDFKIRLNKHYHKIDLENAQILHFELNNYFDIFRDGEFQSDLLNNTHIGAYAFVDDMKDEKIYFNVDWSYSPDNMLNIEVIFKDVKQFQKAYHKDDTVDNKHIFDCFVDIIHGNDRKKALLDLKKDMIESRTFLNKNIKHIDEILKRDYPEVFDEE